MVEMGTCSAMPSPAMWQVVSTVELLERILLVLPLNDVFIFQRVSKDWQALIRRSLPIRQKLFLAPLEPALQKAIRNPALAHQPSCCYKSDILLINPIKSILQLKSPYKPDEKEVKRHNMPVFGTKLDLFPNHLDTVPPLSDHSTGPLYAHASWQNMYVTQPPVTAIRFSFQDPREGEPWGSTIECGQGITLGLLRKELSKHDICPGKGKNWLMAGMGFVLLPPFPDLECPIDWHPARLVNAVRYKQVILPMTLNGSAAMRTCLHTPELLECILLQLPLKSLFGVQRVCTPWRDTIRRSRALQRKMFLHQGSPLEPQVRSLPNDSYPPLYDPTDLKMFPESDVLRADIYRALSGRPEDIGVVLTMFPGNPRPDPLLPLALPGQDSAYPKLRIEASWCNAYLTQPPVTSAQLQFHDFAISNGGKQTRAVTRAEGLRLVDLYQAAYEFQQDFGVGPGRHANRTMASMVVDFTGPNRYDFESGFWDE